MTNHASRTDKVRHELRSYAIIVLYLWAAFSVLLLYKSAVLSEEGVKHVPLGLALVKALVLGKFLMLGEIARVGSWTRTRNLLTHIVRKVGLLLVLLIILTVVEEIVAGWIHGQTVLDVAEAYERRPLLELIATCLYMLLVLTPYVAVEELSGTLGPGVLRRLLLERPGASAEASHSATPT